MLKLVVWDLDNTIWDGIYVYDGENVKVKSDVIDLIKLIDSRNVLQSIVSRNPAEVKQFLKKLGLLKYFILPKIEWRPKNEAFAELLQETHILPKDVAFIDDDEFELNLIKINFPEVFCIKSENCKQILEILPTETSKSDFRKQFFKDEERRLEIKKQLISEDEYLKTLDLKLKVKYASMKEMQRVLDLINRTNQLNSTGKRYASIDDLLKENKDKKIIVGYPEDKFGAYGLCMVAIADVKDEKIQIHQFINSCRVLDRKLLGDFLKILQERFKTKQIQIIFKTTKYNYVLEKELLELGFKKFNDVYVLNENLKFIHPIKVEVNL